MEFIDTTIGDIVESTKTGKTPNTKEPLYYKGGVLWVTPTDLKGQQYISETKTSISKLAILDNQAFLHEENTVLMSCIGDIGKAAMVKQPISSNQQITGIRVKENIILPKFFFYWILRNKAYLGFKANKVTIPILNNKNLRGLQISIPKDLEFQRKVTSQLDFIQNHINDKIKIIHILEKLTHSVYHEMFGDPVNNQKGFKLKKLSQLTREDKPITRGIENPGLNVSKGVSIIKTSDISNGKINIREPFKTSEEISNKFSRSLCSKDDILMTIRATVGECAKVTEEYNNHNITRGTALISPNQNLILSDYLLMTFLSDGFKFIINKKIKGSTFKQINLNVLKEIKIPVPEDISIQKDFSLIYEAIEDLKNKIKQSLEILHSLFHVILQNAFKPDVQIDEEPIFKDLIKKFTIQDLKGNKQRLQYLINLFEKQRFDTFNDFTEARKILFNLIEDDEIIQTLEDDIVKLHAK